jgi:hypothetical protein
MIKFDGLQHSITCKRGTFELNTDYRIWLQLPDRLRAVSDGDYEGYISLFADDFPPISDDVIEEIVAFYNPPKELPRSEKKNGADIIDYILDSDYIYAGFMQAYGIDLVDVEHLHWHKFLALVEGLPEDTVMSSIIQFRSYDGKPSDPGYKEYMRLQYMWALPTKMTEEEEKKMAEFEAYFGG